MESRGGERERETVSQEDRDEDEKEEAEGEKKETRKIMNISQMSSCSRPERWHLGVRNREARCHLKGVISICTCPCIFHLSRSHKVVSYHLFSPNVNTTHCLVLLPRFLSSTLEAGSHRGGGEGKSEACLHGAVS